MGLYGGWCSCILYTVVYISILNDVKCTTVLPSSSPLIGNSVSTDSLNIAMSLDTNNVGASSTIDIATSNSDVSVLVLQTSSIIIAPASLIVATTASPVDDPSQDFTSALEASYTTMPSPPSIKPSQTLPATSSYASEQDLSTLNQLNSTLTLSTSENVNMPISANPTVSSSNANSDSVLNASAVLSTVSVQTTDIVSPSSSVGGSPFSGSSVFTSSLQSSHTASEQSSVIMGSISQSITPSSTSTEMSTASSNETVMTTDLDMATHISDNLVPSQTEASSTSSMTSTSATLSLPSSASYLPSRTEVSTSTKVSASTTTANTGLTSSIKPTSTIAAATSRSVVPTTPPTTTPTTTKPPSTTIKQEVTETVDSSNVFKVETNFTLKNCTAFDSDEKLRKYIDDKNIPEVRKVVVVKNNCSSQASYRGRRKRQATKTTAVTKLHVNYDATNNNTINEIINAFANDTDMISLDEPDQFRTAALKTFDDPCQSDVCEKHVGFKCTKVDGTTATCYSECRDETCSGHGSCIVVVDGSGSFGKQCVCETEGYYKYEGVKCENRQMTWELAVAIAGGTAGGIILILIFALMLCWCCKSSEDQYKYRRDSYEPMSELVNKPAYYRNDGPKTHQTGFNNFGYEEDLRGGRGMSTNGTTWNPDDSKDTYEKIGRMSQQLGPESSFQIKRPQVAGSRQSSLNEATNEGEDGLLEMSHRL